MKNKPDKVLYIGYYKDGTGWSDAAQNYILAMDKVGIDVVPRAINLLNAQPDVEIPERILELEEKEEKGCNICIQHLLPHMMEFNGNFDKNIAMFAHETSHFRNTNWAEKLNLMDQVWVFNSDMVEACKRSHVHVPIKVLPHTFDISKYTQSYEPLDIPELKDKFVFYTICEVTRRKNLPDLLKAFHLEFSPEEDVKLLIKGSVPKESPSSAGRIIRGLISEIKHGLNLYPDESIYNSEIIITSRLSEEEMMRLHATGDCFVLPSYGEAWGQPGFDAMAMGKTPLLTDEGGPKEYLRGPRSLHDKPEYDMGGMPIKCREEYVFIRPEEVAANNLYIGNEKWKKVDLDDLRRWMRKIYSDRYSHNKYSHFALDIAEQYSYNKIGSRIQRYLKGF